MEQMVILPKVVGHNIVDEVPPWREYTLFKAPLPLLLLMVILPDIVISRPLPRDSFNTKGDPV
jgi:hypothetical protein